MHYKPWRITLDTNPDDCNLHCIMCEEHSPYKPKQRHLQKPKRRRMALPLLKKIMSQALELGVTEVIPSTMGEPLLYQHFLEIVDICYKNNLHLNLTTNGTFPLRGAKEWAILLVPILSDIKISWNGATPKTAEAIMVGVNWKKVNANVKEFIAYRNQYFQEHGHYARVTFQLTFMNNNIEELPQIVELAISLGVDRVKGHHLWTHFDDLSNLAIKSSRASVLRWNQQVQQAQKIAKQNLLPNKKAIVLENITALELESQDYWQTKGVCPFLGKELWCNTEGKFSPCCAPNEQRLALGDFGNINDTSLKDIWNGQQYQELVASYHNHELCSTCNMKKPVEQNAMGWRNNTNYKKETK